MFLVINTTENKKFTCALIDQQQIIKQLNSRPKIYKKNNLLKSINNCLRAGEISLTELNGIVVVNGPANSFSRLRVSLVIANLLARLLNIPVVGIKATDFVNLKQLSSWKEKELLNSKKINQRSKKIIRKIILPNYGKQPNINLNNHGLN
ncbi:MAG: hypothetical protein KAS12_06800 [Candidatus Aenigmarchaeota archaeon]|nr:hypothetical protein [Candidatus Aenigmarchaeota archaeon]